MSLTQSQERVFAIVSVAENGIAAKTVAKQMHLSIMRISEVLRELLRRDDAQDSFAWRRRRWRSGEPSRGAASNPAPGSACR